MAKRSLSYQYWYCSSFFLFISIDPREKQAETSSVGKPLRVLFIGNGLTFCRDFLLQVEALASDLDAEPELELKDVPFSGEVGLLWHLSPDYSGTLDIIRTGGFEIAVIQGLPRELLKDPEGFVNNTMALANEVKAVGAEVIFYETWAYDTTGTVVDQLRIYEKSWSGGNPGEMQARIREVYSLAASEVDGYLAPVGDAWEKVLGENPEIELFGPSGEMPSECGSYLAACVFVNALTNLDPRDAKWRPEGVSRKEAIVLRSAAWEVGMQGEEGR